VTEETRLVGPTSRHRPGRARDGRPYPFRVQPSSKAEPHPRGRPVLERGGTSLEGASSPRTRRSFVSVVPSPSSEAEFRLRGAGLTVWRATGAARSVGPCRWAVIVSGVLVVASSFCVLIFAKQSGLFPVV
jgi:hypothetical protein